MKKSQLFTLALLVFSSISFYPQEIKIPLETTFFNGKVASLRRTVSKPVTAAKINALITEVSKHQEKKGDKKIYGGTVVIPSGRHMIEKSILLKSNVYIEVNSGAELVPRSPFSVFNIAAIPRSLTMKNIRIYGKGGKFTINYSGFGASDEVNGIKLGNINGFRIENILMKDNKTFLSGISMSPPRGKFNHIPRNGIIENCEITNADYGYGLIQVQGAKNVLFKNLKGEGGVSLRLESGWDLFAKAGRKVGKSTELYAQNIYCENGNAAVMVSPHTKLQGKAVIKDITAINCSFGARIDNGIAEEGEAAGVYETVIIGGKLRVWRSANENSNLAQIKYKHYSLYPKPYRDNKPFLSLLKTGGTSTTSRKAPGIAPLLFDAQESVDSIGSKDKGRYRVTYRKTETGNSKSFKGFRSCTPDVVYQTDRDKVCLGKSSKAFDIEATDDLSVTSNDNDEPNIFPIPADDIININAIEKGSIINIYNTSNSLVKSVISNAENTTIDVSSLASGIYIFTIQSSKKLYTVRVSIQ